MSWDQDKRFASSHSRDSDLAHAVQRKEGPWSRSPLCDEDLASRVDLGATAEVGAPLPPLYAAWLLCQLTELEDDAAGLTSES